MPGGAKGTSITIAPAHIGTVAQPGNRETFTVYSAKGTHVTMTIQPVTRLANGQCATTNGKVSWATVTPAAFTIGKRGHRKIHVQLAEHGSAGKHDVAILATAALPGHGNVHLSEAVGSQLLATYPGHTAKGYHPCLTLSAPPKHASSVLPFVLVAVIAILIFSAIGAFIVGHHRGAHPRRQVKGKINEQRQIHGSADHGRSIGHADSSETHRGRWHGYRLHGRHRGHWADDA